MASSSNSNIEHGVIVRQWKWPLRLAFWWVMIGLCVWCGTLALHWYWARTKAPDAPAAYAQEVLRVRQTLVYQDWVPLKAAASQLELEVRRPTPEMVKWAEDVLARPSDAQAKHRLELPYAERVIAARNAKPDTVLAYIQAFRIGDLGIASIPFEVFTETGLEIKANSPFKDTFTIELANGSHGYLPTPKHHDLGGYETWLGTNRVERAASLKITARALETLERLHAAP